MYVVAFNGPPKSGKDTVGQALMNHPSMVMAALEVKLATRLRATAMVLADIDDTDENYAEWKDKIVPAFGVSLRQLMIDLSEKHAKPLYGQRVWSKLHWSQIESSILFPTFIAIVTDVGFQFEIDHMVEKVGDDNLLLINLYRDGYEWGADSRGWVTAPNRQAIRNDGTPFFAADQVAGHMSALGWYF